MRCLKQNKMKKQAVVMGMLATVNVIDSRVTEEDLSEVFSYFHFIDKKFSTYKVDSEISQINRGELKKVQFSNEMKKILALCEETKKETDGYFDANLNGILDPSGLVKGYAIFEGAEILRKKGFLNYFLEIAGDIQTQGKNEKGESWRVGIQNPFNTDEIIKVVRLSDKGIATSGNYIRGNHIYNPRERRLAEEIAGITVIGPNVYEADRFATATFAMGEKGIEFIEKLKGFEGYMVKKDKQAVFTSGFEDYIN
jgi:thiamine biosynthesis lipoprotein